MMSRNGVFVHDCRGPHRLERAGPQATTGRAVDPIGASCVGGFGGRDGEVGKAGSELREQGCVHGTVCILCRVDNQYKMSPI
jgi:hypothetical protein